MINQNKYQNNKKNLENDDFKKTKDTIQIKQNQFDAFMDSRREIPVVRSDDEKKAKIVALIAILLVLTFIIALAIFMYMR